MRTNMRATFAMLLIVAAVSLAPAAAQQTPSTPARALAPQPGPELALTYTYLHANVPPNACGCFSMNGGSASFAYPLAHSFSIVAEAGAEANSNVTSSGLDLTLSDYLAGPRYSLRKSSRITPFAQLLLGAAHTSGALSPGQFGLGSSTAFAMATGGGLDLNLTRHLAWRVFQTDYLLTLFPNRANDHQNNFRFSTGVVFHFGNK
jgi:outer membrane immunogenic protein